MSKKGILAFVLIIASIFGLIACGSNDKSSNDQTASKSASGTDLNIIATNFQFDSKTYKVPANKEITINFKSKEGNHGLKIDGTDVNIKGSGTTKVTLKPGTYNISCSVFCGSGHAKMQSKIVAE